MQVEFEIEGLDELQQRLGRLDTVTVLVTNEGLRDIGRLFVPHSGTGPLADETPVKTGKLAASTYFQVVGGATGQQLEIRQPARTKEGAFYGRFVREGTRPHVIVPRRAKALRFISRGEVVFARRVNHPGTKANPYHIRVFVRLRGQIQQVVNRMGHQITAFLAGRER